MTVVRKRRCVATAVGTVTCVALP